MCYMEYATLFNPKTYCKNTLFNPKNHIIYTLFNLILKIWGYMECKKAGAH